MAVPVALFEHHHVYGGYMYWAINKRLSQCSLSLMPRYFSDDWHRPMTGHINVIAAFV